MMSANLYLGICAMALVLIGGFFSVQIFRGRMSWGQARRMGIPMTVFGLMIAIYYLALLEGVYGFVGFILDLPLWIDVLFFLVLLVLSMAVYFKLIHREKFKPALFTAAFLVPLSIPGLHTAARLAPSKAPVEILQNLPIGTFAKKVGDSGYEVKFQNTHEMGRFGDWLTARRLTAQGYKKRDSKLNAVHGIDGVYVRNEKDNPQKIQEILIVENKVGNAQLNRPLGQMTDEWINDTVEKMLKNDNDKTRSTGELIRANPDLVRKELWRHDLDNGSTTISRLDGEANIVPSSKGMEHYMSSLVRKRCETKQPTIVCLPASR